MRSSKGQPNLGPERTSFWVGWSRIPYQSATFARRRRPGTRSQASGKIPLFWRSFWSSWIWSWRVWFDRNFVLFRFALSFFWQFPFLGCPFEEFFGGFLRWLVVSFFLPNCLIALSSKNLSKLVEFMIIKPCMSKDSLWTYNFLISKFKN